MFIITSWAFSDNLLLDKYYMYYYYNYINTIPIQNKTKKEGGTNEKTKNKMGKPYINSYYRSLYWNNRHICGMLCFQSSKRIYRT